MPDFAPIHWRGRQVSIEHAYVGVQTADAPFMVFLHEGLGSLAMWKDFPQQLCSHIGFRGLVYSRPGYGQSTPRASGEHWDVDFMHQQAHEVLPALLQALGIDAQRTPVWLLGHSDGGSIALLFAARHSASVAGAVVLAPHIFVEDISVQSITHTRHVYQTTDLRSKLARYHSSADSAFWGWNDIWLKPEFRAWNIERELAGINCPLLAVQGVDDEYGTLEQIRGIQRHLPHTQLLELPHCGHSPHRDQPQALMQAIRGFVSHR
jgi:pimeloyl-ACP methyl ester carboxylesterase